MVKLSINQLNKRNNWCSFKNKIIAGEAFELVNGGSVVLDSSINIDNFEQYKKGVSYVLPTATGNTVRLSELAKTKEFGSNGRTGTECEDAHLNHLRSQIKSVGGVVPIKIGDTIFQVADVISTPGTPKSDFHFVDVDGNEICWISHKDGTKPKDFQQWGGLTEKSFWEYHSEEIMSFIEEVRTLYADGFLTCNSCSKRIRTNQIKFMSVYGVEFGKAYSRQNVNVVIQGKMTLEKEQDYYIINAHHILINGDLIENEYEPIMYATYRSGRTQFGIKNARFGIYPKGFRKAKVVL